MCPCPVADVVGLAAQPFVGQAVAEARRRHARDARQPVHDLAVEGDDVLVARIALVRQRELGLDDAVGAPAVFLRQHLGGAAQEERGARHQEQRQRELADEEDMTRPDVTAGVGRAASAALQGVVRGDASGEQRRPHAAEEDGRQRDHGRKGQDAPVHRDGWPAVGDDDGLEPLRGSRRDEDGTDAAGSRHQRGFEQHGPDQLQSRGAEGGADGELAGAIDGPGQQQVGQVRARHEQHAPGQAEERRQQGASGRAGDRIRERLAPPRGPGVRLRRVGGRLRGQRGQEHVGLRRRHRGAPSSEDGDRARRAIGARRGVEAQRAEDPDAAEQPVVAGGRREHAHDSRRVRPSPGGSGPRRRPRRRTGPATAPC